MSVHALGSTAAAVTPRAIDELIRSHDQAHGTAMPLRVINVEATIKNRETGGIYFARSRSWHVISHTWSADVRKLSDIVGERLKGAAARGDGRSYEELFQAAGFHEHESYRNLVKFLIILRADNVRWVWFDAVCINQTDSKEKDDEIQQMGTYYESSVGCHVVHHGIGKGFTVLMEDGEDVLPRWFSRAWTFQEWMLPQKTTFIVDLASDESLRRTANNMLESANERSECSCCEMFEMTFSPIFVRKCMRSNSKVIEGGGEEDLSSSAARARRQRRCRSKHFEPHFRKIPDRRHWYFADDLGYLFLGRLKLQMKNVEINDWPDSNARVQFEQKHALTDAEFQLTDRLAVKGYFSGLSVYRISREKKMALTIKEISARDCSHPEDRVLSVLKLLGVEGAIQVRSEKSLKEQIMHLASSLVGKSEHNEMLLRLCLVDGFGNDTPGMSWAPHFEVKKGSWQEAARNLTDRGVTSDYFDTFEARAQVREVSSAGELQVVGDVCAGQLICCDHDKRVDKNRRRPDELFRTMVLEVGGRMVLHLCARASAEIAPDTCVLENVSDRALLDGSFGVAFSAPGIHNRLHQLQERMPVWLVKMGVGEQDLATYFLVCIGDQHLQSPLHKIGYLGLSSSRLPATASEPTLCFIGGLGSDLSKHLFGPPLHNLSTDSTTSGNSELPYKIKAPACCVIT